ncbi:MAG: polynucleotide adenylyltransferase PcnB [Planctomycetota bacterium]|nr:polynucleotide adenylyltransferase PcnB [Planctomycetota bacterium]
MTPQKKRQRGSRFQADAIDPRALDPDARRVVKRLQRHGHEAYFVGGCVRDLLIGREPKDFDVATSASPSAIRRLFRNGRIIGRRFRLVHIYYGDRICETATFRREPPPRGKDDDLLIREDNEFGTAEEDSRRRDFTVNGLFLNPSTMEVIDYVDGLDDLRDRLLRTIGDPFKRLSEDPVRIMRAVKFATRLDFEIEEETWEAMCDVAPDLCRSAPPRVLEEILRLLRAGTGQGAFRMLWACGALEALLPDHADFLGEYRPRTGDHSREARGFFSLLEALDSRVTQGYEPSMALCMAVLYMPLVTAEVDETKAHMGTSVDSTWRGVAWEMIEPLAQRARLSRKEFTRANRLIAMQPGFHMGTAVDEEANDHRFSPLLFARNEDFDEALDLFGLAAQARGKGRDIYESWVARHRRAIAAPLEEVEDEQRRLRKGSRRRRRRRSKPKKRRPSE